MIVVNNKYKLDWYEGMTVRDILDKMDYTYPLITVSVNKQLVLREDYEIRTVPNNAEVNIFHLAHGG